MISIITINLNNKDGLIKTIESVINQTHKDYEYIIIDGGSTDGSIDIIKEYAEKIDYWVSEPDKGIYNAMNKGIAKAHGEYLNFMNSGDAFYNETVLSKILPYLNKDIVSGKNYYENGVHGFYRNEIKLSDFFKGTLPHQATFIKKTFFDTYLYDENLKIVSDWKFFIEALVFSNATFSNIDIIVCKFDGNGISAKQIELINKERDLVYKQLFPPRIIKDYKKWEKQESALSPLLAEFNDSVGYKKFIKNILTILIKIRNIRKR